MCVLKLPKKAKKKKSSQRVRSDLAKKCLRIWSEIIAALSGNLCQKCGKTARDSHHIVARGKSIGMSWFDIDNGVRLCYTCHRDGAHSIDFDKQVEFQKWVALYLERNGIDYEEFKIRMKARNSMTKLDLLNMYGYLIGRRTELNARITR